MAKEVTSMYEFQTAIDSKHLTVVDFYATWCGPCKAIAPAYDQLASKHPKATFLKINVEKLEDVAHEYRVTAMPTFLFFKNGLKIEQVFGTNLNKLQQKVEALVEEWRKQMKGSSIVYSFTIIILFTFLEKSIKN